MLRGIAALAVVVVHSLRAITVNKGDLVLGPPILADIPALNRIGAYGVDIFFVLSGFLMVFISGSYLSGKKSVGNFLLLRAIRIWPMYALCTLWVIAALLWSWHQSGKIDFDLRPSRLASFAFIPTMNEVGLVQPILSVGWTLNYEAGFYLSFALAMLLPYGSLLARLAVILLGWQLAALALPGTVASLYLGNTIVAEFLFGAVIARLYQTGRLSGIPPALSLLAGIAVLVASSIGDPSDAWRFGTAGIGASLLFIGFLRLDTGIQWPRAMVALGDASYSIYLTHLIVIYGHGKGMRIVHHLQPQTDLAVLFLTAYSVALGYLAYRFIEAPLLAACRRQLRGHALAIAAKDGA